MITNLSSPAGSSINDGICDVFARVSYASLDTAINLILEAGQNPFLAKSDIKSAFRLIPIDSAQYHLLCFEWKGLYYFDACLPMGARSSCAIFESFSTALETFCLVRVYNCLVIISTISYLLEAKRENAKNTCRNSEKFVLTLMFQLRKRRLLDHLRSLNFWFFL